MERRELTGSPRIAPLYLRAAATLIPGAGRLPGVPGGGGPMPALEIGLRDVMIDPERLSEYARICGFAPEDAVPATFLHVLAFPLHMALMSDGRFPFAAIGLVHVENEITQLRPIAAGERVSFTVKAGPIEPHPRGLTFSILTSAHSGGEPVWRERSTMLRRGGAPGAGGKPGTTGARAATPRESAEPDETRGAPVGAAANGTSAAHGPLSESWRVPEDIGRRYGAVSGDRNPIHIHRVSAKAFGFPRAIAHGMWTKARSLAALGRQAPESFTVEVSFRKPVLLPASTLFEGRDEGDRVGFSLRSADGAALHLEGQLRPIGEPARAEGAPAQAGEPANGVTR
ncbi:MAG: hypothetical protein KGJ43_03500 [Acidobacteriota bacterium]|nr:hypothetical protein [Acidobacteriota bacterium]